MNRLLKESWWRCNGISSHSNDKKKNQLNHKESKLSQKVLWQKSKCRCLQELYLKSQTHCPVGYKVSMVAGSDRIRVRCIAKKYNGTKARHGFYKFDEIQIVSAGEKGTMQMMST